MAGDIIYLLNLGVTIEEIAERAGRTPTAIQAELDAYSEKQRQENSNQ
ncbi:hypothetical protein [Glutamicibacter sp. TV12E]